MHAASRRSFLAAATAGAYPATARTRNDVLKTNHEVEYDR